MKEQKEIINGKNEKVDDKDDIYETEEIEIEEMAIDGICGVY